MKINSISEYFDKPKLIDFQMMFSQLHLILDSGTTLQYALKEVAQYVENRRLKNLKQTPWCETSPCYKCGSCEK